MGMPAVPRYWFLKSLSISINNLLLFFSSSFSLTAFADRSAGLVYGWFSGYGKSGLLICNIIIILSLRVSMIP